MRGCATCAALCVPVALGSMRAEGGRGVRARSVRGSGSSSVGGGMRVRGVCGRTAVEVVVAREEEAAGERVRYGGDAAQDLVVRVLHQLRVRSPG